MRFAGFGFSVNRQYDGLVTNETDALLQTKHNSPKFVVGLQAGRLRITGDAKKDFQIRYGENLG